MTKALITGGTGFLGKYLVKELVENGISCRLLVRPTSNVSYFEGVDNIEFWPGDITKSETLIGVEEGVDYVYHLAAVMGHLGARSATKKQWDSFIRTNLDGTRNLADRFVGSKLERFIFISSTAAMGIIPNITVDEATPIRPKTPYQCSKAEAEQLLLDYWGNKNLPVIILRPSVFYGRGMVGDLLKLCKFVKLGIIPHIGGGSNLTPLFHVNDLVETCVSCLKKGRTGQIYILTGPRSYAMREITNCLKSALNKSPFEVTIPVSAAKFVAFFIELCCKVLGTRPLITVESVISISADRKFSIEKAQQELNFEPKTDLEKCINDTVEWLRERGKI